MQPTHNEEKRQPRHRRSQEHEVQEHQPRERRPRRHFSLIRTILMLLGLGVVIVALGRYVVVPVLVALPSWMGGAQ